MLLQAAGKNKTEILTYARDNAYGLIFIIDPAIILTENVTYLCYFVIPEIMEAGGKVWLPKQDFEHAREICEISNGLYKDLYLLGKRRKRISIFDDILTKYSKDYNFSLHACSIDDIYRELMDEESELSASKKKFNLITMNETIGCIWAICGMSVGFLHDMRTYSISGIDDQKYVTRDDPEENGENELPESVRLLLSEIEKGKANIELAVLPFSEKSTYEVVVSQKERLDKSDGAESVIFNLPPSEKMPLRGMLGKVYRREITKREINNARILNEYGFSFLAAPVGILYYRAKVGYVMQKCAGVRLDDYLVTDPQASALIAVAAELCSKVAELHKHGLFVGDYNLKNFLIDREEPYGKRISFIDVLGYTVEFHGGPAFTWDCYPEDIARPTDDFISNVYAELANLYITIYKICLCSPYVGPFDDDCKNFRYQNGHTKYQPMQSNWERLPTEVRKLFLWLFDGLNDKECFRRRIVSADRLATIFENNC